MENKIQPTPSKLECTAEDKTDAVFFLSASVFLFWTIWISLATGIMRIIIGTVVLLVVAVVSYPLLIKAVKRKRELREKIAEATKAQKMNQNKADTTSRVRVKENGEREVQKYNKAAIIGLVFSAIAVFGMGLFGLIGLVLGIAALVQIKHTQEKGKGLAITAVVVGFVWSFVVGILRHLVEAGF